MISGDYVLDEGGRPEHGEQLAGVVALQGHVPQPDPWGTSWVFSTLYTHWQEYCKILAGTCGFCYIVSLHLVFNIFPFLVSAV
jgi:hypothetical protein